MTGDDDDFLPRLGKMRAGGSRQGRKFLQQVIAATMLAGGGKSGAGKSRKGGGRTARGAGAGRVLASRDRYAAFRQRRVIVKSRIVRLAGKGIGGARAHLRYIQRDGVTRDGNPGELYDATHDRADGKEFLDHSTGDRHQFRFIVSAEDGDQYDDLKPLIRRLMARMEADLDTRLEWVAVDHFNTGHPHSHVIVRGKADNGADLVIAQDYLAAGCCVTSVPMGWSARPSAIRSAGRCAPGVCRNSNASVSPRKSVPAAGDWPTGRRRFCGGWANAATSSRLCTGR